MSDRDQESKSDVVEAIEEGKSLGETTQSSNPGYGEELLLSLIARDDVEVDYTVEDIP